MKGFIQYDSPIGILTIVSDGESITEVLLPETELSALDAEPAEYCVLIEASKQLQEYFNGTRTHFQLPLFTEGTPFQMRVWDALRTIPFGESLSYAEIAEKAGSPKAVRAVGQANKANKLPILVPCHRVIGKNKSLTGYAGTKTDLKAVLLELEKVDFR
ncbi:methylated-DNA--[protein]-cysteine S-methyltransferase [Metabacillus sp. KIGAM252]|uniref:Methylated-DNA--protein-cysteine methyltransferase n=1 Tax=Metabacillus flavus TaxID=2823519 RepID=A0ABS5LCW3_9BACI|nr:methylated-DNA--[protein]-cysteine S-methyltransferase [Metabacillus flavus]MBS2968546.1 methylated-DNA--[protein]-cysteine S-methyltransferase [Metabacillus flavus]